MQCARRHHRDPGGHWRSLGDPADEIGVSDMAVGRARRSGASDVAPDKRIGKDGKSYPARHTVDTEDEDESEPVEFKSRKLPVEVRQGRWMHARIHGESHEGADHDKENGQPCGS
jgi:hypothetical protein